MIQVQVVTAGQILQRFLETLRCLAQPFAIGILSDDLDDFAHVAGDGARVEVLAVIQQNFFRWLVHGRFPSSCPPRTRSYCFRFLGRGYVRASPWGRISSARKSQCTNSRWWVPSREKWGHLH